MTTNTRAIDSDANQLVKSNLDDRLPQCNTPEEQARLERKLAYKQTLLDRYAKASHTY